MMTSMSQRWNRRGRRYPRQPQTQRRPKLRFNPTAWAKLLFLRDRGPTEVGAFGISSTDNLLRILDIELIAQRCTESFVTFDDVAVAEFFDHQIDLGRRPDQCGRIWIHTHPGHSAEPSAVDRDTFLRVFGPCDWAVMMILARGGGCFAELHWRHGGPATLCMDVEVDFTRSFPASDEAAWAADYDTHVRWEPPSLLRNEMPGGRRGGVEKHGDLHSGQRSPFEDNSLANFCHHPLAWEMA